jgi:hypothetical protein
MKPTTQKTARSEDLELVTLEAERFYLEKLLRRWECAAVQKLQIEATRDDKLRPFRERFDKDSAPAVAAADSLLAPIVAKLQELENELTIALLAAIKADGTIPIPQLLAKHAIAEVTVDQKREISPAEFFATIPAADRHSNFWKCLRVQIGEASHFLGKETIKRLAKFNRTHGVTIRIK